MHFTVYSSVREPRCLRHDSALFVPQQFISIISSPPPGQHTPFISYLSEAADHSWSSSTHKQRAHDSLFVVDGSLRDGGACRGLVRCFLRRCFFQREGAACSARLPTWPWLIAGTAEGSLYLSNVWRCAARKLITGSAQNITSLLRPTWKPI